MGWMDPITLRASKPCYKRHTRGRQAAGGRQPPRQQLPVKASDGIPPKDFIFSFLSEGWELCRARHDLCYP